MSTASQPPPTSKRHRDLSGVIPGPNILGHAPAQIDQAVAEAYEDGLILGEQHPLEVRAAEILCEVLQWPTWFA